MPAPFPLIKLGALLVKQISKPIANFAKERAKTHPFFRTYVCMPPAQFYNWCEIKLKMWVMNLGKPVNIPTLSEAMAIELGANLLGEGIVFTIAVGVLFAEYTRSAKKDAAKEAARQEELNNILYQIQELCFRIEQQDTQIRQMHRNVTELESKKWGINILKSKKAVDEPPSPPSTIVVPISSSNTNSLNQLHTLEYSPEMGVVLNSVRMMEYDIIGNDDYSRENGFLTNALLYVEQDIFRRPISV